MKTIVITGVSRGMGEAVAEKFLAEGWMVIGTSTQGTSEIKHKNLKVYAVDMLTPSTIKAFITSLKRLHKKIDVLHNNAGISLKADHGAIDIDILLQTLEVNLIGLIDITEQLLPLINKGGRIINMVSSAASLVEYKGAYVPAYQISKVAVNMYTRELATRLEKRGIIVASFDPGWVRTDMGGKDAPRDPEDVAEELYHFAHKQIISGYVWHNGKIRAW